MIWAPERRGRHPWGRWARRRRLGTLLGALGVLMSALLAEMGTGLGRWLWGRLWAWLAPMTGT